MAPSSSSCLNNKQQTKALLKRDFLREKFVCDFLRVINATHELMTAHTDKNLLLLNNNNAIVNFRLKPGAIAPSQLKCGKNAVFAQGEF